MLSLEVKIFCFAEFKIVYIALNATLDLQKLVQTFFDLSVKYQTRSKLQTFASIAFYSRQVDIQTLPFYD